MASNVDSKGRKICNTCGKVEGTVKFTANKGVCNICRGKLVIAYENSPERLMKVWKVRNSSKAKAFMKGKKDPCSGCCYGRCELCVVFHLKKRYLTPKSEEARAFIKDFSKNLLDNIRKVVSIR